MAKFNGVYSYRSGYHGVRKSTSAINVNSDFWICANGHRNPNFELVDDRANGGFVHREKVTVCKKCAAQQGVHLTAAGASDDGLSSNSGGR